MWEAVRGMGDNIIDSDFTNIPYDRLRDCLHNIGILFKIKWLISVIINNKINFGTIYLIPIENINIQSSLRYKVSFTHSKYLCQNLLLCLKLEFKVTDICYVKLYAMSFECQCVMGAGTQQNTNNAASCDIAYLTLN